MIQLFTFTTKSCSYFFYMMMRSSEIVMFYCKNRSNREI